VNAGGRAVFIEKHGWLRQVPDLTVEPRALSVAIRNIARGLGEDWSEAQPILDARLEDGSRVAAVGPPVAVDGATLTIRRFGRRYSLAQLSDADMLSLELAGILSCELVESQRTILITGGTGCGKTTLLNALAAELPSHDRIVLLEDTAEVYLERENLVRLNTVRARPMSAAVTMTDLLRVALRHRPDRIIVGEVRGPEAFDLLQALNTGHEGSLSTLHANGPVEALRRFAALVQMAGHPIPYSTVCDLIASTGCLVVHLSRIDGVRRVVDAQRVLGYEPHAGGWIAAPVSSDADPRITPSAEYLPAMGVLDDSADRVE
jgi:pilus assembly protein CpaF